MIIKSRSNAESYIEIKERITAGVRQRYLHMKNPKVVYNNGKMSIDPSHLLEYETNPNIYLLSQCITKIVEEGIDKTPKATRVSDFIELLDTNFYDEELLEDTTRAALELYNFLETKQKPSDKEKKETNSLE